MIATVTMNPAIDKTMTIPGFAAGATNRGAVEQVDAGGKGINVANALRQLGCPVVALGFQAERDGGAFSDSLAARGILTDFVKVPGETRVNLKIKDPATGAETEINQTGFRVGPEHLAALRRKVEEHAGRCAMVVFSGSLPPGAPPDTYADLIGVAACRGARTVLDASGEALKLGAAARPDLIKPNRGEAEELLCLRIEGERDAIAAARRLLSLGPRMAVISLGAEGALAATGEGMWRARAPRVRAASSTGAGDAMVAALAWALTGGAACAEALRRAVAAGTASAALSGSRVATLESIEELLPQVVLESVDLPAGATP